MNVTKDASILTRIGTKKVAETFGITRQAVYEWRKRGIPDRHRAKVAELATSARDAAHLLDGKKDKWFAKRSIYAITDIEDRIRYVGQTHISPMDRAIEHLHAKTALGAWMRENPWGVEKLQVCTASNARSVEREWVLKMQRRGEPLFNRHLTEAEKDEA